jgi:polyhydroxybutyrate depolymerase
MSRSLLTKLAVFVALAGCMLAGCALITPQHAQAAQSTPTAHYPQITDSVPPASTGCGKHPLIRPGTSANALLLSGRTLRTYRLHLPIAYNAHRAYPLVLSFHGHGQTAFIQELQTHLSALADHDKFVVVYPQGTVGADGHTGWNTGPPNYPHVNDVAFVADLLNHIESTICINPERVYASGFSNGGGFTNVLACEMSSRFAAFAIVSGGMHPVIGGCHPARAVPLLEIYGTGDRVVPYTGNPRNDGEPPISQWLTDWARLDSCTGRPTMTLQERGILEETWHSCKSNSEIVSYQIVGGKHDWPAKGLDASTIIWDFFQRYSLGDHKGSSLQ